MIRDHTQGRLQEGLVLGGCLAPKTATEQSVANVVWGFATLNVLDAYHPMVRNGPRGTSVEDVVEMRTLLASTDIVALDAAAARLLGHQPSDVRHVRIGDQMKLGTMNLDQIEIRRFKLA